MESLTLARREGWLGNLTTLSTLQRSAGLSNEQAARLCFVSPETYRRWKSDRKPNPCAVRLMAVMAGYMPWQGWHRWEVIGGCLFEPGARRGLLPGDIQGLPFLKLALEARSREVMELRRELEALRNSNEARPRRAGYQ
ncbi:MAG: hypothetical protein D6786_03640 [Gammaproteobacteria bacterium]|nr:MAG: hypothetical protein D6786_03640 [Gammaproteobacteria bacterium]